MSEEQNQPPEIGATILATVGSVICWSLSMTFLLTALSMIAANKMPTGILALGAAFFANPLGMKWAMEEQIKQGQKPWSVGAYLGIAFGLCVFSLSIS